MPKKSKEDPTGQARNRNKSTRELWRRLNVAEGRVKDLFRSIKKESKRQVKIVNVAQTTVYEYEYSLTGQKQFEQSVGYIVNEQLLGSQLGVMPFDWYFQDNIELPYRQGTAEESRDFNMLIAAAIAAGVLINGLPPQQIPVETILMSDVYRNNLGRLQVSAFSSVKGLSEKVTAQVLQRINNGIQAGESPKLIANDISKRFEVARADAKRISETEINRAYNDAKMDATRLLAKQTGLRAGVIHISALTPTTRPHHAARHGNAYTVADQQQWWNEGANRINCKCTTRSVLINNKGEVVQKAEQETIKEEGKNFFN